MSTLLIVTGIIVALILAVYVLRLLLTVRYLQYELSDLTVSWKHYKESDYALPCRAVLDSLFEDVDEYLADKNISQF